MASIPNDCTLSGLKVHILILLWPWWLEFEFKVFAGPWSGGFQERGFSFASSCSLHFLAVPFQSLGISISACLVLSVSHENTCHWLYTDELRITVTSTWEELCCRQEGLFLLTVLEVLCPRLGNPPPPGFGCLVGLEEHIGQVYAEVHMWVRKALPREHPPNSALLDPPTRPTSLSL